MHRRKKKKHKKGKKTKRRKYLQVIKQTQPYPCEEFFKPEKGQKKKKD